MLKEKAGNFDLESYNMREAPIKPRRVHKYDFSDPIVIEVNILHPHLRLFLSIKSFRK